MQTALDDGIPLDLLDVEVSRTFYAAGLFVSAPYRRYGIGSALIRGRMLHFHNLGYKQFASLTNGHGEHIKLYERLGYEFLEQPIHLPGYRNPKLLFKGEIGKDLAYLDQAST